jgi:hypothetical protein
MHMPDFLKNIILGSSIGSTEKMDRMLKDVFVNPVNTEWSVRGKITEAIFYKDNKEHIAHFNRHGDLLNFKVNLPLDTIPAKVRKVAGNKGEIINVVMIRTRREVQYEVICHDSGHARFLLMLDGKGRIISERAL